MVETADVNTIYQYTVAANGTFQQITGGNWTAGGVAELVWAAKAPNTAGGAAMVWQGTNGDVQIVNPDGSVSNLYVGGSAGDHQVTAWQRNGEFTFAMLIEGVVNIVSEFGSGGTAGFTWPVPILGGAGQSSTTIGVQNIYGCPTDSSEGTLFALDLDDTLSVLTRAASGWTQNVVYQDAATNYEVASWRVQLTMLDTNGVGVDGGSVRLTPDRPIGIWYDNEGSTWAAPDNPVTVTLDGGGRLTFSIPAAELDTAVITGQPLDSDGNAYGDTFTITPNIDVQNFLAGSGSLDGIGSLNNTAMLGAKANVWDPVSKSYQTTTVFPALVNLPNAGAQNSGAWSSVYAINHVASAGLGSGLGLAAAIIGNLSYEDGPLAMPGVRNDYTLTAKLIIDAVGNFGAAVCYLAAAILAS
jgi:hypothetical protein